ncbi:hypothetical protein AAVH_12481 [Aphelenchoides avenae]|nr:hypothetical protein AAVH_12481 [Aphelenchus avenae]
MRMMVNLATYNVDVMVGYTIIIWCEYKVAKHLRSIGVAFSSRTRKMHDEAHKALIALAITPFITLFLPLIVFMVLMFTQKTPGWPLAFLCSTLTSVTLSNPITTAFFVRPYRRRVIRVVSHICGSIRLLPSSWIDSSSDARWSNTEGVRRLPALDSIKWTSALGDN